MILKPNCRYGHGPLVEIKPGDRRYWGLFGVTQRYAEVGTATAGMPLSSLEPNQTVFTLKAFKCATCGYMELFDEGADVE